MSDVPVFPVQIGRDDCLKVEASQFHFMCSVASVMDSDETGDGK